MKDPTRLTERRAREARIAQAKTATTNPLRTVRNLEQWVRDHVEPFDSMGDPTGKPWPRGQIPKALLWWHACNEAQGGWGDLRVKDIADILLTGLKPLKMADLQEALDSAHESEDESEPAAVQIEASLREHFRGALKGAKP